MEFRVAWPCVRSYITLQKVFPLLPGEKGESFLFFSKERSEKKKKLPREKWLAVFVVVSSLCQPNLLADQSIVCWPSLLLQFKSSSATQVEEEEEEEAKESFKPIRIQNSCVATSLHLSLSASLIKRIQRSLNE